MKKKRLKTPEEALVQMVNRSGLIHKSFTTNDEILENIDSRIEKLQNLISNKKKHRTMTYFVMYDIENDRVRRLIAKYLEKKGLIRIQKSIFIGDTNHDVFKEIAQALASVQQAYENNDSLLLVPVSSDELRSMKIIGKNIDIDLISGNRNTLIF